MKETKQTENTLFKNEKAKKAYEALCNKADWLGDVINVEENELYRII